MLPNKFPSLLFKFLEQFEVPTIAHLASHSKGVLLEEYNIYLSITGESGPWKEMLVVSSG